MKKVGALPSDITESTLLSTTRFVLRTTGTMVKESAKPPYMPEPLLQQVEPYIDTVWNEVEELVTKSVKLKLSPKDVAFRELRVHFWPPEPSKCSFRWMRAKVLYALMPADGNAWKSLRDPFAVLLLLLRLQPLGGTPVFLYIIVFGLIDRSDEYQLVNFCLKFKTFAFISGGLCIGVYLSAYSMHCLYKEQQGETSYCLDHAPGSSGLFTYTVWFEPLRFAIDGQTEGQQLLQSWPFLSMPPALVRFGSRCQDPPHVHRLFSPLVRPCTRRPL